MENFLCTGFLPSGSSIAVMVEESGEAVPSATSEAEVRSLWQDLHNGVK